MDLGPARHAFDGLPKALDRRLRLALGHLHFGFRHGVPRLIRVQARGLREHVQRPVAMAERLLDRSEDVAGLGRLRIERHGVVGKRPGRIQVALVGFHACRQHVERAVRNVRAKQVLNRLPRAAHFAALEVAVGHAGDHLGARDAPPLACLFAVLVHPQLAAAGRQDRQHHGNVEDRSFDLHDRAPTARVRWSPRRPSFRARAAKVWRRGSVRVQPPQASWPAEAEVAAA